MRLQGDANDIATVLDAVYKCFNQVDVNEHKKTEAELIAQQVRLGSRCNRPVRGSARGYDFYATPTAELIAQQVRLGSRCNRPVLGSARGYDLYATPTAELIAQQVRLGSRCNRPVQGSARGYDLYATPTAELIAPPRSSIYLSPCTNKKVLVFLIFPVL